MLDTKWIVENPDAFDKAMEARNCPQRAEEIILLNNIRKENVTLEQIESRVKKLKAELFFLQKNNKPFEEKVTEIYLLSLDHFLQETKLIDAKIDYQKFLDKKERESFAELGIIIPDYWEETKPMAEAV